MRAGSLQQLGAPWRGEGKAHAAASVSLALTASQHTRLVVREWQVRASRARPFLSFARSEAFNAAAPSLARCCCVSQLSSRSRQSAGAARVVGLALVSCSCVSDVCHACLPTGL